MLIKYLRVFYNLWTQQNHIAQKSTPKHKYGPEHLKIIS